MTVSEGGLDTSSAAAAVSAMVAVADAVVAIAASRPLLGVAAANDDAMASVGVAATTGDGSLAEEFRGLAEALNSAAHLSVPEASAKNSGPTVAGRSARSGAAVAGSLD